MGFVLITLRTNPDEGLRKPWVTKSASRDTAGNSVPRAVCLCQIGGQRNSNQDLHITQSCTPRPETLYTSRKPSRARLYQFTQIWAWSDAVPAPRSPPYVKGSNFIWCWQQNPSISVIVYTCNLYTIMRRFEWYGDSSWSWRFFEAVKRLK